MNKKAPQHSRLIAQLWRCLIAILLLWSITATCFGQWTVTKTGRGVEGCLELKDGKLAVFVTGLYSGTTGLSYGSITYLLDSLGNDLPSASRPTILFRQGGIVHGHNPCGFDWDDHKKIMNGFISVGTPLTHTGCSHYPLCFRYRSMDTSRNNLFFEWNTSFKGFVARDDTSFYIQTGQELYLFNDKGDSLSAVPFNGGHLTAVGNKFLESGPTILRLLDANLLTIASATVAAGQISVLGSSGYLVSYPPSTNSSVMRLDTLLNIVWDNTSFIPPTSVGVFLNDSLYCKVSKAGFDCLASSGNPHVITGRKDTNCIIQPNKIINDSRLFFGSFYDPFRLGQLSMIPSELKVQFGLKANLFGEGPNVVGIVGQRTQFYPAYKKLEFDIYSSDSVLPIRASTFTPGVQYSSRSISAQRTNSKLELVFPPNSFCTNNNPWPYPAFFSLIQGNAISPKKYWLNYSYTIGCWQTKSVSLVDSSELRIEIQGAGGSLINPSSIRYQWFRDTVKIAGATDSNYTAAKNGLYIVQVINETLTDTFSFQDTIVVCHLEASARTYSDRTCLFPGDSAFLTCAVPEPSSYQWKRNGLNLLGATDSTLSVHQGGTYTCEFVNLISNCTHSSKAIIITSSLEPQMVRPVASTNKIFFCYEDSSALFGQAISSWGLGWLRNGSPIPSSSQLNYLAKESGIYQLKIGVGGCVFLSNPISLRRNSFLSTPISISDTAICSGSVETFSAVLGGGFNYNWNINGTSQGWQSSPVLTVNAAATVYYEVMDSMSCSNVSAVQTTVNITNPSVPFQLSSLHLCELDTLHANTGSDYYFQWYRNGWPISAAQDSFYILDYSGDYFYTASVKGACVQSSDTLSIKVQSLPVATINVSGPSTFCQYDSTLLRGSIGMSSYRWLLNNAQVSFATSDSFYAKLEGLYSLEVTDSVGCRDTSPGVDLFHWTKISAPSIIRNQDTLSTLSGSYTYQWFLNGALLPMDTNNYLVSSASGVFEVLITDINGCQSRSTSFLKSQAPPISNPGYGSNFNSNLSFTVFPNPSNGFFNVVIETPSSNSEIIIRDKLGRVLRAEATRNRSTVQLDLSNYGSGLYLIELKNEENVALKRLVLVD